MAQRRIIARRSRNLRTGLFAAVAVVLCAMWVVAGISVAMARRLAIDHARAEVANMSAAFAEEMRRTIGDINGAMKLVAEQISARNGNYDLYRMRDKLPLLASQAIQAAFVSPDGLLQSSTLAANPKPVDLSDREHIRVQLDGSAHGLFIGKPVTGRVSNQVTLQFTRRVEASDGRLLGVLVFSVPPVALTTLHDSIDIGRHGFIGLVGLDNVVRARFAADSPEGLKGIGGVIDHPSPAEVAGDGEGSLIRTSDTDHVTRIVSDRRIPGYPLVVAAALDLDTVLADARASSQVVIAIVAAASLLFGALVIYLAKEIKRRAVREIALVEEHVKIERAYRDLQANKERAEHAEARLADAVNCISEAFVIYDKDDRLVMCNDAYRKAYPLSAEIMRPGVTFEALIRYGLAQGEYREAAGNEEAWLQERLRRHHEAFGTVDQALSDGRHIWVTERRMESGGIAGLRIDVTKLVQAENALRETLVKAEAASQAKSLFLANMSHELRTPLNAIIGFSEAMAHQVLGPGLPRAYVEYSRSIHGAGVHLLEIIANVLDISQIEAGKDEIEERPVDVAALADSALAVVRVQAERKRIALDRDLPARPFTLWADALKLRQILINLLVNGVKFTLEGGRVALSFAAAGESAGFIITDTGCGMSREDVAQAIEPFQQIENSLVKRHEGMGLGLTLAKRLTEMHGGTLIIESEKGVGTTVRVNLPATRLLSGADVSVAVA